MTTRTGAAHRLASVLAAAMLGGCFSLSVQTPGEPLPPKELRMRTETRQFAAQMSERVQRTADAVAARPEDAALTAASVKWKLGTSIASRRAAYRSIPRYALVDTWTLAAQMEQFFGDGNGRELFGARQVEVVKETSQIAKDARALAARHLDAAQLARYDDLVRKHVTSNPLADLAFVRAPVPLSAVMGDDAAPATVGTAPEVVADATERFDAYGQSIPDEVRWRTQLLMAESGVKSDDVARLVARTDETLRRVNELADSGKAAQLIDETRADLQRGWAQVDQRWVETLGVLQTERAALSKNLESAQSAFDATLQRERVALYDAVARERKALTSDAERYTVHVVQEARAAVREFIFWAVAVLVLVFGTTFGVGFALGRATRRRANAG